MYTKGIFGISYILEGKLPILKVRGVKCFYSRLSGTFCN